MPKPFSSLFVSILYDTFRVWIPVTILTSWSGRFCVEELSQLKPNPMNPIRKFFQDSSCVCLSSFCLLPIVNLGDRLNLKPFLYVVVDIVVEGSGVMKNSVLSFDTGCPSAERSWNSRLYSLIYQ